MKITLENGRPARSEDIESLEARIGSSLGQFGEFVLQNDGARPSANRFDVGSDNSAGVDGFIPVSEIGNQLDSIDCPDIPGTPIAWASCGNLVYLDREGAVYFWDHELDDETAKLGDCFNDFLEMLEPDEDDIELNPEDVISVWVDPEFRKQNPDLFLNQGQDSADESRSSFWKRVKAFLSRNF